ncbi:MAG: aromatic ring-hydroxylating dioxygenase subunit alpha [Roseitalea sp.]|jgi:phenylpropionate dioxygenase-like ring-hydroxylating dioxygenase large terminal subunit|nr:aromatic ring-hydroxylating dioxygenase subunit alpha [Roseitalea sp.]MBO6723867.1 aromatic ring-hydroxylating dioxygenase subunit alpha [Roseitalea sp.]MBO6742171.1 aromatic ring-hydroxylating dioxygenase subunit alpha [Roseitalea sp.]
MNVIKPQPDAGLRAVLQPVDRARGLPNRFYTSPETFEREKHAVFARNWAGIGFAKDLPEPGYARPVEFAGQPLLMLRDRTGTVRVFDNVCRHRGMILVEQAGPIRSAIRCPYHSWCYDLDGALKATPHVGGPGHNAHEEIDRASLGLREVQSHIWRDIVFVNLSGTAPDFADAHAALIARWADFDHPLTFAGPDSAFSLDVATNWKLAVENYCESYHLPWVHPGLNAYSRLEDHYNIEEPGAFSGQGTHVYRQLEGDGGERFGDAPGLPAKWDMAAEYIALYPNVLLGVHRDHSFAILLEPRGPQRTVEHVALYYHDAADAGPGRSALRERNAAQWKTVFEEDIFVVEGMQRGRHAAGFDGGRFSPVMDSPTHLFHHWIASCFVDADG